MYRQPALDPGEQQPSEHCRDQNGKANHDDREAEPDRKSDREDDEVQSSKRKGQQQIGDPKVGPSVLHHLPGCVEHRAELRPDVSRLYVDCITFHWEPGMSLDSECSVLCAPHMWDSASYLLPSEG